MSLRSRAVTTVAALTAAGLAVVALAPAAQAKPKPLKVTYDASGSTLVAKTNSSVALGPTELKTKIAPDGSFKGSLALPPSSASFKIIGLLPTTATVTFVSAAKLTGQISTAAGVTTITSSASYYIKLSNVSVAGIPAFVGNNCQTVDPVAISVGGPFSVVNGGTLGGTYTIGNFANCGLTTALVNALIPGPDNTVSFTLSNGRLG